MCTLEAPMKSTEFKRWLAKQGVTFGTQTGSHLKLFFQDSQSVLPMHHKDISKGLLEDIKKQLGLKNKE
jgi:mRNA interferase HicA